MVQVPAVPIPAVAWPELSVALELTEAPVPQPEIATAALLLPVVRCPESQMISLATSLRVPLAVVEIAQAVPWPVELQSSVATS